MGSGDAATSALLLNDTPESELGPGVFLDTATDYLLRPAYNPVVTVPSRRFSLQNRILDVSYHKRFGVTFYGMENVLPNVEYEVIWRTPPGGAVQDNGDWELEEGRTCGYWWCLWITKQCRANQELYGIGVIEDGARLSYQAPWRCYAWSFLPIVVRR
jgi:hypothetical protein